MLISSPHNPKEALAALFMSESSVVQFLWRAEIDAGSARSACEDEDAVIAARATGFWRAGPFICNPSDSCGSTAVQLHLLCTEPVLVSSFDVGPCLSGVGLTRRCRSTSVILDWHVKMQLRPFLKSTKNRICKICQWQRMVPIFPSNTYRNGLVAS